MDMKNEKLKAFIQERSSLNVSALEQECKMPRFTLHKFLKEHIPNVPERHWPNLEKVLQKYGWNSKES